MRSAKLAAMLLLIPLLLQAGGCRGVESWTLAMPDLYQQAPSLCVVQPEPSTVEVVFITARALDRRGTDSNLDRTPYSDKLENRALRYGVFSARAQTDTENNKPIFRYEEGSIDEQGIVTTATASQSKIERAVQPARLLANRVAGYMKKHNRSDMLIYVHGYNVRMDQALRHGIQLQSVLPNTQVVVFSWPSKSGLLSYGHADAMARTVATRLRDLVEVAVSTELHEDKPGTIWLLGHSTGARIISDTLLGLPTEVALGQQGADDADRSVRTRIILAAPDMSTPEFLERFVRRELPPQIDDITVYFSGQDWALFFSDILRMGVGILGGNIEKQLKPEDLKGVKGLAMIDAAAVRDEFIGHSYIVRNPVVLTDLNLMVERGWSLEALPEELEDALPARAMRRIKDRNQVYILRRDYIKSLDLTGLVEE